MDLIAQLTMSSHSACGSEGFLGMQTVVTVVYRKGELHLRLPQQISFDMATWMFNQPHNSSHIIQNKHTNYNNEKQPRSINVAQNAPDAAT